MKFAPQNVKLKLLEVYAAYGYNCSQSNKRTGRDKMCVNAEILFPVDKSCNHCSLDLRFGHPFCPLKDSQRTSHWSSTKRRQDCAL